MSGKVLHDLVTRADRFREQEMKAASRLLETVRHFPSEAGVVTQKRGKKTTRDVNQTISYYACVHAARRRVSGHKALARSVPVRHRRVEEVRKASAPNGTMDSG